MQDRTLSSRGRELGCAPSKHVGIQYISIAAVGMYLMQALQAHASQHAAMPLSNVLDMARCVAKLTEQTMEHHAVVGGEDVVLATGGQERLPESLVVVDTDEVDSSYISDFIDLSSSSQASYHPVYNSGHVCINCDDPASLQQHSQPSGVHQTPVASHQADGSGSALSWIIPTVVGVGAVAGGVLFLHKNEDNTSVEGSLSKTVSTYDELVSAIANPNYGVITIAHDIKSFDQEIVIDRDVVIDGGHNILSAAGSSDSTNPRLFAIANADKDITVTMKDMTLQYGGGNGLYTQQASTFGGAIYNEEALTLDDVTVTNNIADFGGGVYLANGSLTLTGGGSIEKNDHSTIREGGGVYIADGSLIVDDASISNNHALYKGGGIYVQASSLSHLSKVSLLHKDATVKQNEVTNESGDGGGIYAERAIIEMKEGSNVLSNKAPGDGAGVALYGGARLEIEGGTITDNASSENGGGVYVGDLSSLHIHSSEKKVISKNAATDLGNELYLTSQSSFEYSANDSVMSSSDIKEKPQDWKSHDTGSFVDRVSYYYAEKNSPLATKVEISDSDADEIKDVVWVVS